MAKIVAAALSLYSLFLIEATMPGLPTRIPTHFNLAGKPNGWGSPHMLWVLLAIQVVLASILLAIPMLSRRFPQFANLGTRKLSDFTPEQRELVMPLLGKMAGFMGVATTLFFLYIIRETIRAAEASHPVFHMGWALGLFLGCMIGIPVYYMRQINRLVEAKTTQPR